MALRPELRQPLLVQKAGQKIQERKEQIKAGKRESLPKIRATKPQWPAAMVNEVKHENKEEKQHTEQIKLLEQLLKLEHNTERISPALLKKRKRKHQRLHL